MSIAGFPLLSSIPEICGGRPVIDGTRTRVSDILDILAGGASEQDILDDFPYVTADAIRSCLAFAARSTDHCRMKS
ncbi:DUF433 domain-containing protein [Novosphingopyxis sp.]|uniref:DUF433 domain-containing protein n=1 Tax=Novosphingopyxis sp. TaxID=2709690 RepID=UPI003B5CF1C3